MIRKTAVLIAGVLLLSGCSSHSKYAQRLRSSDVSERRSAAQELRGIGRNDKLVPALLEACRDPDSSVRSFAFLALANQNPTIPGVPEAILLALDDTVLDVRRSAVSSLGAFNPFPNVCFPAMIKLLVDKDHLIRSMASGTFIDLGKISVPILTRALKDKNPEMRMAVADIMGSIGADAKAALISLRRLAENDDDLRVREVAQRAVDRIEE